MDEEIFETQIGIFKILPHPEKSSLVFVKTHLSMVPEGEWEDLGWMKKKDFLKMVKPHNPRPMTIPKVSINLPMNYVDVSEKNTNLFSDTNLSMRENDLSSSISQIKNAIPEKIPEILLQSTEPAVKAMEKGVKMVPFLKKRLSGKEKFPFGIARILDLCDGYHSVEDICKETNYTRLEVTNAIREYQKKK